MAISAFERVTNDRTLAATVAVHAASTMAMVGLIWTVQVVHYPLFESVGAEAYPNYQSRHIDRIGAVLVVPWGLPSCTLELFNVDLCDATNQCVTIQDNLPSITIAVTRSD